MCVCMYANVTNTIFSASSQLAVSWHLLLNHRALARLSCNADKAVLTQGCLIK